MALLAACYAYEPGSFRGREDFPGKRVELGCLDLAVAQIERPEAPGTVVQYTFGNRCDHRVGVDLATVSARGTTASGAQIPLVAFDPRGELRPIEMIARWGGRERIAYRGAEPVVAVCVDVGGVDQTIARRENWVCP